MAKPKQTTIEESLDETRFIQIADKRYSIKHLKGNNKFYDEGK